MLPRQDQEDARLVAEARAGSHDAYATLIARYKRPLFRFLSVRVASSEDAEELLQEAFMRGWTQLHRFDLDKSFSAWLYTIAARIAVSWGRRPAIPIATEREIEDLAGGCDPATLVEQGEANQNLWALATKVLGEEQRSALWLAYGESRSAREIGMIMGRQEVAVRVMLCRARQRLAAHIRDLQRVG